MLFVGVPMGVVAYQIPQRFQIINGMSSLDAGVRLLPYGAAFTFGNIVSGRLSGRLRVPTVYLVLVGSALQIIGYTLMSKLSATPEVQPAIYGYMVLVGVGGGLNYLSLYITIPFVVDKRDKGT